MSTSTAQVWHHVREVRLDVADRVEGFDEEQAATQSLCEGWRVRDVVGHLVHLAEATQLSVTGDLVRHGPTPDRMLSWKARELGEQPLPELAARLRAAADGHFRVVGLPPQTVLGEVVVHREDALRPLAVATGVEADEVVPVLDLYRRIGRVAFARTPRGVRLVATDATWQSGDGPEVEGRAIDLLLVLAGRPGALDELTGPGVAELRRRWQLGPVVDPPG